jgi:hypothetical protein
MNNKSLRQLYEKSTGAVDLGGLSKTLSILLFKYRRSGEYLPGYRRTPVESVTTMQ